MSLVSGWWDHQTPSWEVDRGMVRAGSDHPALGQEEENAPLPGLLPAPYRQGCETVIETSGILEVVA